MTSLLNKAKLPLKCSSDVVCQNGGTCENIDESSLWFNALIGYIDIQLNCLKKENIVSYKDVENILEKRKIMCSQFFNVENCKKFRN